MDQEVRDADAWAGERDAPAPLTDVLAFLEASVETLCAVDWAEHDAEMIAAAVGRVEVVARRLDACGARATAELAALHRLKGRSAGGVAAMLAEKLGLAKGTVHGRIEAGGRQATPAGRAAAGGEITGEHERIIAKAVSGLPGTMGGDATLRFAEELTQFARSAAPADLRAEAARRVAALCPDRGRDREEHQERQRTARLGAVRSDGTSTLTMTLTPRARALVERALCDFGGPGGAVECEPGTDDRTPEQRAHDALVHQWALGSTVDPARPKGIGTIIVRVTPEQLEDPTVLVRTDAGTQLSVRQAVSLAGAMPWFVSLLRDGREELHRIDVDSHPDRRLASAIQRLVLYAAHGGCTYPGCSAPARRSQFHHVRQWSRGGPTTVANGALACPVHHGFVGDGPSGWKTVVDAASPGLCRWLPPGVDRLTDV
ncbi:HNH endonuclease signature motif containing protein [Dietzia alimentaria]|uniref:HNH endonuclease signature motif containing protein n=1 Tax=Dietzia alimentaria TaxID=665550 RepID=UPI00029A5C24|nr:HNH endonuclease signature motif containing protein [Dietzia alimentaria]